jgi:predicted secreted hydrolase
MLSFVRDAAGGYPLVYGTWVTKDGRVRHLDASEINLTSTGTWLSPTTGTLWPSGWSLEIERLHLAVTITPEVANQELDTRASTGVVYWEGASAVVGTRGRRAITGQAYVELTGYASLR